MRFEKVRYPHREEAFGHQRHDRRVRFQLLVLGCLVGACSAGGDKASFADQGGTNEPSVGGAAGSAPLVPSAGTPQNSAGSLNIDVPTDEPNNASAETCDGKLTAVVRDFQPTHPDFEFAVPGSRGACYCSEKGIVGETLGPDNKPVYVATNSKTTSSAANFDQWYRDVPGVNQRAEVVLQFQPSADGTFSYDSAPPGAPMGTVATKAYPGFFPIDGQLFGNSGNDDWTQPHNYHFTLELDTAFVYEAGDVFKFRGDDDVWVFIDGKLVIDLGGIHVPEPATVSLDTLGLTAGQTYPLHFFFAERHVTGSNFLMETNLRFVDCDAPK